MLYTSPGGSSNLVWITMDDQTLGEVNFGKSSAILVDQNPEQVAYLCGGESFDERSAQCAAFQPDRATPLWKIDLGNTGLVEGGFWHQGCLYVSTKNGKLLAIQENINAHASSALSTGSPTSPPIASPAETRLEWSFTFPEDMLAGYLPPSDRQGSLYGLSENFTLYAINPNGSSKYSVDLPTGIYKLYPEEQNGYLLPVVLQDGTVVIISDDKQFTESVLTARLSGNKVSIKTHPLGRSSPKRVSCTFWIKRLVCTRSIRMVTNGLSNPPPLGIQPPVL